MKRNALTLVLMAATCRFGLATAAADDWPTWRCDAARSGASPEVLPDNLRPRWIREFRPVVPAWPNEPRLGFDTSYEPVAADGRVFLGSPHDGSLRAFDLGAGEEQWRFYTEGPVRFAPVAAQGRVYVASDDGYLYCVEAATGRLAWKVRGAPQDRPDRRHLGNARLVSFWPVRGGPVLADGTVYFSAGIWPTMGVFVVAVDAQSGRVVWRNDALNHIDKVRLDHNDLRESALSPQGYLAVERDLLLVPNGRSMPAGLDRKTGKLLWYVQGYRNGDCRVVAGDRYALVGDSGVVDLETGREVGSRWAAAGKDAPDRFDGSKFHLFEGPIHPYKLFPGCTARSVLAGGRVFGQEKGFFYAYDLGKAAVSEYETESNGRTLKPWRWDAPLLWKLAEDRGGGRQGATPLVKAGDCLVGYAAAALVALKLPTADDPAPKIAWKIPFEEAPSSLVVAGGRLLVATRQGRLHCLAAGSAEVKRLGAPIKTAGAAASDQALPGAGSSRVAEILKLAHAPEGYGVVLGLGDGRLLSDLVAESKLKVIGVDADAKKVHRLRRTFDDRGLYGNRVELFVGDPAGFPLPPYLADLVVTGGPDGGEMAAAIPLAKLTGILRPYGGTACLANSEDAHKKIQSQLPAGTSSGIVLERAGGLTLVRRDGRLPGSAPWTHECSDAARSFFSWDELVKPPLGILWYGDGPDYGFWKHKDYGVGVKPQVVGGRVFALRQSDRLLIAYDAYTGRHLWQAQVSPFTRYVSMADGIHVAGDGALRVLDPASGAERHTFRFAAEGEPAKVSDIRLAGDVAVIAAAAEKVPVIEKGLWDSTMLFAVDRTSGKVLWKRTAAQRFNNNALAMGGGAVFAVDSRSPIEARDENRRTDAATTLPATSPSTILALDARTGTVRWSQVRENGYRTYGMGSWLGIRGNDDWLGYCEPLGLLLAGKQGRAYAFEATSGREVWQAPIGAAPWVLRGETLFHQGGGVFDIRTGKQCAAQFSLQRGGCNYFVAGPHLLFLREKSVSYVDLETRARQSLHAIRSGCSNSLIAADGLLNVPNFAVGCVCNYPIQTSFAMAYMPDAAGWAGGEPRPPEGDTKRQGRNTD
jgi:outer membrane protein assembly factor BamB